MAMGLTLSRCKSSCVNKRLLIATTTTTRFEIFHVFPTRDHSRRGSRPGGTTSRIELRARRGCGEAHGHGPVLSRDDLAAGHASHRNDVRGDCLFLETMAQRISSE